MPLNSTICTQLTTQQSNHISLQAMTPDQLLPYVHAVSQSTSFTMGSFLVHYHSGHAIVVGYPLDENFQPENMHTPRYQEQLQLALGEQLQLLMPTPSIERLSVLAPVRAHVIPENATILHDNYYILPLPLQHSTLQKVHSTCRRAAPYITIEQSHGESAWSSAHQELMLHYIGRQGISKEMSSIFQSLGLYCRHAPQVRLFSAYDTQTGELLGYTVGDFTSLHTAFYMFAFRKPSAHPGTAEVLLMALLEEAQQRGYSSCNLGLGIHKGIRFFKEKWGAVPALPFIQCSWLQAEQKPKNQATHWLARLFS